MGSRGGCEKCWLLKPTLHKDMVADGTNLYLLRPGADICLLRVLPSELFRARVFPPRLVSAKQGGCTGLDEDSRRLYCWVGTAPVAHWTARRRPSLAASFS